MPDRPPMVADRIVIRPAAYELMADHLAHVAKHANWQHTCLACQLWATLGVTEEVRDATDDELHDYVPTDGDRVFLLTPSTDAPAVWHQYGGLGCLQWEGNAEVVEAHGALADAANALSEYACEQVCWGALDLQENAAEVQRFEAVSGLRVREVHEGLIAVSDGRLIATENCD